MIDPDILRDELREADVADLPTRSLARLVLIALADEGEMSPPSFRQVEKLIEQLRKEEE